MKTGENRQASQAQRTRRPSKGGDAGDGGPEADTGRRSRSATTAVGRRLRANRLPLRGRLALLAATAVALSVAAAALVSYHLVDGELNSQLNQTLVNAANGPQGQSGDGAGLNGGGQLLGAPPSQSTECVTTPSPFVASGSSESGHGGAPGAGYAFHGGGGQYVTQTVETDGTVCLATIPLPGSKITEASYKVASTLTDQAVAAGTAKPYFRDAVTSTGVEVRVYTEQVRGQEVAIQAIAEVGGLDDALSSLAWKLALVALAGILLAVLAGLLVARSALVPVRRLTRVAEHVGRTGDLSVRLPAEGRDEVGRLGRAFNRMASALDLSRDRQRRLIADAGHELRTPLTSLRTNVDLLLRSERSGRALPAGRRESMLESVDLQLHELSGLVTDLLELSRTAEGSRRPTMRVALHEAVGRAVERARLRGPGLVFDVEVEPWYVQGDPTGLDRAVVNLLDNAVKFSPPGGVVTVRLKGGEYSVTDQGPGIAAEDLPKVFERFYRSDSARSLPGSGLGLAIVAQVAKESGGTISLGPADRVEGGGADEGSRITAGADAPGTVTGSDRPGGTGVSGGSDGTPVTRETEKPVRARAGAGVGTTARLRLPGSG